MIKRSLLVLLVASMILIGLLVLDFRLWSQSRATALEAQLKTVLVNGEEVKYAEIGEGEPILYVFGGGSGPDAVYHMRWLADQGFRIVSLDREGYLGMPLSDDVSFMSQADKHAAALKALGISRVHVLGVSMGGPVSLYFADRHPDMVQSVVLWSAVTRQYIIRDGTADTLIGKMFLSEHFNKDIISWMIARSAQMTPKALMVELLKTEANLDEAGRRKIADEELVELERLEEFHHFIESLTPLSSRFEGMMYETEIASEDWEAPLNHGDQIPLYSAHSSLDIDVPMEHQDYLRQGWTNGTFVNVEAGGHFCFWGREGNVVRDTTVEFLRANSVTQASN